MSKLCHATFLLACIAACSNKQPDKPKGSADWGDDPRPLGACVGSVKPGVDVPGGLSGLSTWCLEKQTKGECTAPSTQFDYVYAEHETCASRGFPKQCDLPNFPASSRFKECPGGAKTAAAPPAEAPPAPSENLDAAKQAVAILAKATDALAAAKTECKALAKSLAPLRDQLWELAKAHPSMFKTLTDAELQQLGAAKTFEAVAAQLPACKDNVHAKEFAYAMGKLL